MTGAAPMSDKDDEKKPGVYEVDTMPPPPGESDPYSAATRVGAMPLDVLAAMKEATLSGNPLKPQDLPKFSSAPPSSASAEAVAALRKIDGIPVLHEEDVSTRGNTELYVAPVAQQQPPSTPPGLVSTRPASLPVPALPSLAPSTPDRSHWILGGIVAAFLIAVALVVLFR